MIYEHKVCPHCGTKFGFNGWDPDSALEAFEEKNKHLRVCPVRFGIEEPPEEWKEVLERARKTIEVHENNIAECRECLRVVILPHILKENFMDMVKKIIDDEKAKISALKRSIGEDGAEFEDLLEASLW